MPEIKLIQNNSEIGAGTRGAGLGVEALKVVARTAKNHFFGRYECFYVHTENDILDLSTEFKYAKRIDGMFTNYQNTHDILKHVYAENDFPVVLSGDHCCAGGTIAGIKCAFPEKRLGVVWIDAHADIHTPYTTPSGNMHGMPLAISLNEDNLSAKINEPNPAIAGYWNDLKNLGGIAPKITQKDLIYISLRDTEKPEDDYIEKYSIENISVDQIRKNGLERAIERVKEKMKDCDIVYVSFDVDSMDSVLVSKGTGTPVENGLSPEEAMYIMTKLSEWEKTVCIEMVEINPCLDNKVNRMAEVAFEILEASVNKIENRLK
jgi:arginase